MRKVLTVLLISISFIANSQVWISKGAVWHYDWSDIGSGGFVKIVYEKDTLINNKVCNKLVPVNYTFGSNILHQTVLLGIDTLASEFTYANGDTVFYLVNGKFYTFYNFGAKPGDTWNIGLDTTGLNCSHSIVGVDSIGKMMINSTSYRWISVSMFPRSSVGISGKIVERFGAVKDYLFPIYRYCDSTSIMDIPWYSFDCFQDDNFPLYNVTGLDCEYLLGVDAIAESKPIEVYPNPTTGKLHLSREGNEELFIHVFSIAGVEVYSQKNASNDLDLARFDAGIYFLRIEDRYQNSTLKKIVKLN